MVYSKQLRNGRQKPGHPETAHTLRDQIFQLAAKVITRSSKTHPADAVLRAELKAAHGLPRPASGEVSRCVFTYFRWLGWVDTTQPIELQIREALRLDGRFQREPHTFTDEELLSGSLPAWVWSDMTIDASLVRAFQSQPRLWLRSKKGQGTELCQKIRDCRPFSPQLSDVLEYSGEEDLFRTSEFHRGEFELQDLNSQAVGLVCDPRKGETWWDACAGEGGKLLHLSDLMSNGGLIWASDRAEWRLKVLRRRAARAKAFNYRAVLWDGGSKLPTRTKFDGILVDAPCSGAGTWGRNPHSRWTIDAEDVKELASLQLQLLTNVAGALKQGGKLIYSVCTLLRSETENVITSFEKHFPGFQRSTIKNPLSKETAPQSELWLRPQDFGGNGMFIAVWRRKD